MENVKTIDVRIQHKCDTYENWMKSSLTLNTSEIAFVVNNNKEDIDFIPQLINTTEH